MRRVAFATLVVVALVAATMPARAARLAPEDYFRHPGEEMERTEFWTAVLRAEDGWVMYLSYIVTNLGLGEGNAGYALSLTSPQGEVYRTKGRYPASEYREDKASGRIQLGPHRMTLAPPRFELFIEDSAEAVGVDLQLVARTEGYKYGDARTVVSQEQGHFLEYFFLAPRAAVTGRIRVEGKEISFVGDGYLEHLVTNRAVTKWSRRWYVLNGFGEELTIHLMIGYPNELFPHLEGKLGFFAVTDRRGVLFASRHPKLSFRKPQEDVQGCAWPDEIRVEARAKKGTARLRYRTTKLHDAYVTLDQLVWPLRDLVASLVGNPIFLRFHNDFELELTLGGETRKVTGKGLHQVICL